MKKAWNEDRAGDLSEVKIMSNTDLGVALLGTSQQPFAKLHQGVVVGRVRRMLLQNVL